MQKLMIGTIFFIHIVLLPYQRLSADDLFDCKNPQGSYATGYCSEQQFKKTDRKLNIVYKKLKNRLDKEQKKILLESQKAWIELRDNDCELGQYCNRNTTGWYTNFVECRIEKTKTRIRELERFIESADCEAGIGKPGKHGIEAVD